MMQILVDEFLRVAVGAGAAVIVGYCICAIKNMDEDTNTLVFCATFAVAVGAFGELASIGAGRTPTISEALLVAGVVASTLANRRDTAACPCILTARSEADDLKQPLRGRHGTTSHP